MKKLSWVLLLFVASVGRAAGEVAFEENKFPLVHFSIAFKVGASIDPIGKKGITRFVMEALSRGTSQKTREQLDLDLDRLGGQLETEVTHEYAALTGEVLASSAEEFLKLVQQILIQPSFSPTEVELLRNETLGLIQEQLSSDYSVAHEHLLGQLFKDHPYGTSPLGRSKDIKSFSRAELLSHYLRVIGSADLVVVGSGNYSQRKLAAWVQETESQLKKKCPNSADKGLEMEVLAPPKNPEKRSLLLVQKPDRTQTQILIGQKGVTFLHPDYHALALANYALGGSSVSTLAREIRIKRGWSYDADSEFEMGLQPKTWLARLSPSLDDMPRALELTLGLVSRVSQEGISEQEFDSAKKALVRSAGFMYNTPRKRVENRLVEVVLGTPKGFFESFGPSVQKLTRKDVNRALKSFLNPAQLQIVIVGSPFQNQALLRQTAKVDLGQVRLLQYFEESL